jgi:hypothetical protein
MKVKTKWCKFCSFLLMLFVCSTWLNVNAENPSVASIEYQDTQAKMDDTAGGDKPNQMLKGNVQIVQFELKTLEEIGPYIKNILKTSTSLYEQATFQPVRVITQPTIIGAGTISNIPIGTEPTGPPKPITKQQLDTAINQMKPSIDLLKRNVNEFMTGEKQLNLPDDLMAQLDPQFTEWIGLVNRISAQEIELTKIRQNPPYDNLEVAKAMLIIQKSAKNLDKVRSSISKVMRKERKKIIAHRSKNN